jgi:hypothetical protein
MPNYAVLHTATGVIRRIELSAVPPTVGPAESFAAVASNFDLAPPAGKTGQGWWKLDAQGNKVEATALERIAALTRPIHPKARPVIDSIDAALAAPALTRQARMDDFLRAFKDFLTPGPAGD